MFHGWTASVTGRRRPEQRDERGCGDVALFTEDAS